jgi:hypothetical protein
MGGEATYPEAGTTTFATTSPFKQLIRSVRTTAGTRRGLEALGQQGNGGRLALAGREPDNEDSGPGEGGAEDVEPALDTPVAADRSSTPLAMTTAADARPSRRIPRAR